MAAELIVLALLFFKPIYPIYPILGPLLCVALCEPQTILGFDNHMASKTHLHDIWYLHDPCIVGLHSRISWENVLARRCKESVEVARLIS